MSSPPGPRAGGPRPRRVFTPAQKLAHLTAYDQACADGSGGGDYLRREGLYSSQITQWRQLRDGGELTAAAAGGKIPKLTAEQAENARLKKQLEVTTRKLATTAAARYEMDDGRNTERLRRDWIIHWHTSDSFTELARDAGLSVHLSPVENHEFTARLQRL